MNGLVFSILLKSATIHRDFIKMNGFVKFVRQNSSFLILVLTPLLLSPMVIVVDEQYPRYSKVGLLFLFWLARVSLAQDLDTN